MTQEDGFTLIEVLIASFVMAILSLMGLLMMNGALQSKESAEQAIEAAQELELARAVIKRDLSQVTSRRARDEYGGDPRRAFVDAAVDARVLMTFVRNGREALLEDEDGAASSLQYVEYRLEDGALVRRSRAWIDPTPQTPERDRVLLADVANLEIEYFDGVVWRRSWTPTASDLTGLDAPPALAISFDSPRFGAVRSVFLTPAAG